MKLICNPVLHEKSPAVVAVFDKDDTSREKYRNFLYHNRLGAAYFEKNESLKLTKWQ